MKSKDRNRHAWLWRIVSEKVTCGKEKAYLSFRKMKFRYENAKTKILDKEGVYMHLLDITIYAITFYESKCIIYN